MARCVVITAFGVISSLGDTPSAIARGIRADGVTFQYADADSQVVVAPVTDFDLRAYTGRHKNLRYLNRGAAMAVAAAVKAVQQAGLTPRQCQGAGLFVGAGPNLDLGGECPDIAAGTMAADQLAALWLLRFLPNTAASAIAQLIESHGENLTVGNACAASLQAIGEAYRRVSDGHLDVAMAGGGDSRLSHGALLAYQKAQALYAGSHAPRQASRPFDRARQGFVPGEGGAFFVLESADHAADRNAPVLAQVCGYGATLDGHAMTAPRPDGLWAETAARAALTEAGLDPAQIETICAHGTGTPLNDAMEAALIQRVFKGHQPKVLALKSWIGHLASACGAVELALCLCAWHTGVWPALRNLTDPCDFDLNYLRHSDEGKPGPLVLQNFGFGGQNAALVVRPWQS
jgi:3-oxoacyl-[acyl-carrier-protein] synthase II